MLVNSGPIILDGYLIKFEFYNIHFVIQTMPSEEWHLDACIHIRLLQNNDSYKTKMNFDRN